MRPPSLALLLALLAPLVARADPPAVKIGVLNDENGPFADQSGRGSVVAAQLAAEDFAREAPGMRVEIVYADHQNKPDVARQIVGAWLDRDGVTAVADSDNSGVGLAINDLNHDKNKTFLASNVGTSDLTGEFCQPTTVQWTFDTWALANGTARALVAQGGTTWFFLAADYAFGQALERDASALVQQAGGRVLGDARAPLDTSDFSAYLLQAQSSGANVIALANAGTDTTNAIKQAHEFGIGQDGKQRLAGLLVFLTDVDALGLPVAQGLVLTEAFYWDLNAQTRAWSQRFATRMGGRMPTMNHAGVYSSVLAYLRAAQAVGVPPGGVPSGSAVVARMEASPIEDPLFGPVTVRRDGRAVHAMYLFQVKAPAESRGRWDDYTLLATIPADEAFRPMADGGCPLVK